MKIIAFDTSSQACSVALCHDDKINVLHKIIPMQHTKFILSMIKELLDSSSLKLSDLHAIAYGCGPGSFTGVRIASSVAQAIGFAKALPVIPISSLAAIAEATFAEYQTPNILVAVKACIGQVYWGRYIRSKLGFMELIGEEQCSSPKDMSLPDGGEWWGVGDGILNPQCKENFAGIHPLKYPTAEAVIKLAKLKWEKRQWVTATQAVPHYLH